MTTIRRFYLEDMREGTETLSLTGDELHHLSSVLRLTEGTEVELFDGQGLSCRAVIEGITKNSATLKPASWTRDLNEAALKITLIQGITKGLKPELVVEKATELGVSRVLFYDAERSVVKRTSANDKKLERLRHKAVSAAKQCGRSLVPKVLVMTDFDGVLKGKAELKIVLHEGEKKASLKEILSGTKTLVKDIEVLVGPEGGFSDDELSEIISAGFVAASFGPRVLRAETAAITVVSILQYALGDMGDLG